MAGHTPATLSGPGNVRGWTKKAALALWKLTERDARRQLKGLGLKMGQSLKTLAKIKKKGQR